MWSLLLLPSSLSSSFACECCNFHVFWWGLLRVYLLGSWLSLLDTLMQAFVQVRDAFGHYILIVSFPLSLSYPLRTCLLDTGTPGLNSRFFHLVSSYCSDSVIRMVLNSRLLKAQLNEFSNNFSVLLISVTAVRTLCCFVLHLLFIDIFMFFKHRFP